MYLPKQRVRVFLHKVSDGLMFVAIGSGIIQHVHTDGSVCTCMHRRMSLH